VSGGYGIQKGPFMPWVDYCPKKALFGTLSD
jgi:hypothetical protein